jgi:hypothetical protein
MIQSMLNLPVIQAENMSNREAENSIYSSLLTTKKAKLQSNTKKILHAK